MNIHQAITSLYPDLDPYKGFKVQDDGDGQYISEWNNEKPKPTQEALEKSWKLHLENQADQDEEAKKTKYLESVRRVATENDADIDRKEADEFSLFWSRYNATGKMPPIEQYPLIMAQVSEWVRQGKLPNLP